MARKRERLPEMCSHCLKRKRHQGGALCVGCLATGGRLVVNKFVNKRGPRLVTEVDAHDGFTRTRYRGGKRGAPGIDEQDEFERRIVRDSVKRYLDASDYLSSPDGKALPRAEREAVRAAGLGQLNLAARAADDILERNRWGKRVAAEAAKREAEREKKHERKQRELAKLAGEFAKSGR
jgi:hypothetical protein